MQTFTDIKKKFYYPKVFLSFIYLFKYTVKFQKKKRNFKDFLVSHGKNQKIPVNQKTPKTR